MKTKILVTALVLVIAGLIYLLSVKTSLLEEVIKNKTATIDSMAIVNADYAKMVIPCVPDTSIKIQIPEHVKTAWLEYCRDKQLASDEFEKFATEQGKIKKALLDKASEELKQKKEEAGAYYYKVETEAFAQFAKGNTDLIQFISNPNNITRSYLFLGSDDNYWSMSIDFDFGNRTSDKKCPENFKVMLETCKAANTVKVRMEEEATKVFELQKEAAELEYDEATNPALSIYQTSVKGAYLTFLAKTK